jgi:tetratricopeptide (TPR) repeat protein
MKYKSVALFFVLALTLGAAARSHAQPRTSSPVQETDDEFKVTTYKKFVDNREPYPAVAYQAARDYMAKYGKEDDQYTRYLRQWINAYEEDERLRRVTAEKADREQQLLGSFTQKDYAKAYGMARQVLADNPDDLKVLIALGYEGVLASEARNEAFNNDAGTYARKAIQLIEAGKTPDTWAPFKNKEDVLASLYYAEGFYALKPKPENAVPAFIKTAQIDSDRRTAPSTYYYLALAYQNGPYKRLSDEYSKKFSNQPESPESKAALENINKVVDKMIDAYARAVALAQKDPSQASAMAQWQARLTQFYKFRHDNSDVGLNELITGVLKTPLPQ